MSDDALGHKPNSTDAASPSDLGSEAAPLPDPATAPPGATSPSWKPSYVFLVVVTLVNVVADLGTKQWIKRYFEASHLTRAARKIEVIPNYVNLIYATNKGGAWGILQGEQEALRRPFFLVVSVAAIVFILSLYRKLTPGQRALKWGLPLVLGGALGNLVDRIVYGWVIDFIDCYKKIGADEKHWPTFNVADVAICIGVGLMAIDMFTTRETKPATKASAEAGSGSTSAASVAVPAGAPPVAPDVPTSTGDV